MFLVICLTKGSCLHKKRTGLCTINSVYNLWTILFFGFIETSSKNCSYNKWALPVIIQLPLKMLFPCEIPFQHCWTNLEAYLSFFVFVGFLGYSILYSFPLSFTSFLPFPCLVDLRCSCTAIVFHQDHILQDVWPYSQTLQHIVGRFLYCCAICIENFKH